MKRVLAPGEIAPRDLFRVGGKAAGLWHLTRAGFPVPDWRVITTEARGMDDALAAEIDDAVAALGAGPLAVRSSATVEDGSRASYSGAFTSVLGVQGAAAVRDAVHEVWNSAARVPTCGMAVILQRQVAATLAGVAHSVDLTGEKLDQQLIGVVQGAGEALVGGSASGETWTVNVRTGEARRLDPGAGGALTRAHVDALRPWVTRAEELLGRPQDVEFAFGAGPGALAIVQSRPLTRMPGAFAVDAMARGDLLLWDSSNIAESYAGPTAPLTFSFIRASYANVYRETGETLGLDPADVRANEPYYQRLLGYFGGRVYYNLLSWYHLVLQLPGGESNARHMEAMMGVREPLPSARGLAPGRGKRLRYAWRLLSLYRQGPARVAEFRAHFEEVYRRARARDVASLDLAALARLYRGIL